MTNSTEMHQPLRTPLVIPGIPWICVTLLAVKYLSQVALRKGESQNMRHSWVVTVPLAVSKVLAQISKFFHTKVRFPKIHTLQNITIKQQLGNYNNYSHYIVTFHFIINLMLHVTTTTNIHINNVKPQELGNRIL